MDGVVDGTVAVGSCLVGVLDTVLAGVLVLWCVATPGFKVAEVLVWDIVPMTNSTRTTQPAILRPKCLR